MRCQRCWFRVGLSGGGDCATSEHEEIRTWKDGVWKAVASRTVRACDGTRAYAGLASSYYEVITANFERMTDEEWAGGVLDAARGPAWFADLVR